MTDDTRPDGHDADPLDQLLTDYFAEFDHVDELNREASHSLYSLRHIDDQIAELITVATAMRGPDSTEPLRYEFDDVSLTVTISPGLVDVIVQPPTAVVSIESTAGTIPISLDAAGGGTLNFAGPARLRVQLDDRSIVSDPFLIPEAD